MSICAPLDFIRAEGVTKSLGAQGAAQRLIAWDDGEIPVLAWVDKGVDYTEHDQAFGSYPSLVTDGTYLSEPEISSSFSTSRHPRSGVGVMENGDLLLVTVDGRSDNGDGMTLAEFAALLIELGAVDAVNLDGGGSTTLFVEGCSVTGNVNHPSDGGGSSHHGARSVSDGIYVF